MNWWNAGEEHAIAVCRPGLVFPLAVATILLAVVYITTRPHGSSDEWIFFGLWILLTIPVALRRRGAVILTPDSLLHRPIWGPILTVPISGIKRFCLVEPEAEYEVPALRIELLVGGTTYIPLDVRRSESIISALDAVLKARN